MKDESLFYEESGNVKLLGIVLSYVSIVVFTLLLGYVYNFLLVWIPFIYLNFFISLGLGIAVAALLKICFRTGKNRRRSSQIILAVVAGLLANYFQWTAYLSYAVTGGITSFSAYLESLSWIAVPSNFSTVIGEIYRMGMWSVFGVTFNGFLLGFVWLIEFLIILLVPVFLVWQFKVIPFSEKVEQWYEKYTLENDFESFYSSSVLLEQLEKNPVNVIASLKYGTGLRHSKIHIYYLEEEETQYLDLERVTVEGEGKENRATVVDNFKIEKADAQAILTQHKYIKGTLWDFYMD